MKTAFAIVVGFFFLLAFIVFCHGGPAPVLPIEIVASNAINQTPTPFDVKTVDTSKITEADIQATIAHRNALHQQLIEQTLPAASDDVKAAVDKAQNLQKDIDKLALQAARVPVLEAELSKAHKACWRNLFIGGAIGAVLVLFGPKLLGLATMVGV